MKKLLIVLGVIVTFLTATAFITSEKTNTVPGPGGSCKIVGNCTVELRGPENQNKYRILTFNKNSYAVNVSWSAYGYVNGNRIKVGSGIIYSNPYKGSTSSTGSDSFTANADNVHLDDIRVSKCD